MKYNDLDLTNWKKLSINVDSLWIIGERDKSGKHANVYHGNFIPQIPNQLIRRYTQKNETVLDVFLGSGTTLYECENLNRKFIGFDINAEMIGYVKEQMQTSSSYNDYFIDLCNVVDSQQTEKSLKSAFGKLKIDKKKVEFIIMHPPYMDIIKFTDKQEDLSQISELLTFVKTFVKVSSNVLKYLASNRYFAIVIGDIYKNSEVIPLSFYVMNAIKRNFNVKLKGVIVKNIEGNRGKLGTGGIWRYRALKSDYFIFKHEYIFVFKKEF